MSKINIISRNQRRYNYCCHKSPEYTFYVTNYHIACCWRIATILVWMCYPIFCSFRLIIVKFLFQTCDDFVFDYIGSHIKRQRTKLMNIIQRIEYCFDMHSWFSTLLLSLIMSQLVNFTNLLLSCLYAGDKLFSVWFDMVLQIIRYSTFVIDRPSW